MEALSDQPDPAIAQKQRVEDANDFLTICDRLSTGYDSGYYWEDVQRALRIAQAWKYGQLNPFPSTHPLPAALSASLG